MSAMNDDVSTYEVREVVAHFTHAGHFEDAVADLEAARVRRDNINMMASHNTIREKMAHRFRLAREPTEDMLAPHRIYEDRNEIALDKTLAARAPVYIGGAGAGLAIVASGGTLAVAALVAAAGAVAGAGIGSLMSRAIGRHHAESLERQLALGDLLVWVEVNDKDEEALVLDILRRNGGKDVLAHSLTRYSVVDDRPIDYRDPFGAWPT
jgi:hypothetical protein